jgi:hypothetical protein
LKQWSFEKTTYISQVVLNRQKKYPEDFRNIKIDSPNWISLVHQIHQILAFTEAERMKTLLNQQKRWFSGVLTSTFLVDSGWSTISLSICFSLSFGKC